MTGAASVSRRGNNKGPAIASATSATSSTLVAKQPSWSRVGLNGRIPAVETDPADGLNPTTPHRAAGMITELFVWVPKATGKNPAATPAAEPIEDPPGVRSGFHGFRVGPGAANASSAVTVFPSVYAPRRSSAVTTSADSSGTRPRSSAVPHSVGMPAVSMMSLTPIGTPCNGEDETSPVSSAAIARRRALSSSSHANARTISSDSAIRVRHRSNVARLERGVSTAFVAGWVNRRRDAQPPL